MAAIAQVGRVAAMSTVAATWMLAGNANAATELATLAANDNRLGLLLTLFAPALGWVAFNIFGPAKAQLDQMDSKRAVPAAVGLGAAASLLLAQSAEASTELATIAANDNRLGLLLTLFAPALGWVAFNIFGPAKAQLDQMDSKRAVPAAVGLGAAASLLLAQSAEASTELATIAASDNRLGLLATLFLPALGWVAFNIFGPAKAQLDQMDSKRAVPAAVGLGAAASLLLAQSAEASTELATIAASDNRLGLLATLFLPALGWVAFNIFGPAKAQLDQMDSKRAVPAAVGLGAAASLLLAQSAEASTELATIAASDNRLGLIATLFVPALGWVAFNIFGAAKAQLDKMSDDK